MKVLYSKQVLKSIEKHRVPVEMWEDFKDSFDSLARHSNFRLFDIKKLVNKGARAYYRMRIRGYRALFWIEGDCIYVEVIGPRGGIYKP